MLALVASVIVISISGVLMPGPMLAVNIAKSYRNIWNGALMAIGHLILEVPIILLIYYGFGRFFENNTVQIVMSLAGGAMLIWMGYSMFRARRGLVSKGKDLPYNAVTAGILTSGLNPGFYLWWATAGGAILMKFSDYGTTGLVIFIVVHWLCDLFWLALISTLIHRTQHLWGQAIQEWIFIICSLLLTGFGSWFIVSGIQLMI